MTLLAASGFCLLLACTLYALAWRLLRRVQASVGEARRIQAEVDASLEVGRDVSARVEEFVV